MTIYEKLAPAATGGGGGVTVTGTFVSITGSDTTTGSIDSAGGAVGVVGSVLTTGSTTGGFFFLKKLNMRELINHLRNKNR